MQSIETIRLSEKQKQQLSILKRKTGIENWNVLCRWALCISLAEHTTPPMEDIKADSNVEMTWKVFGGEQAEIYLAILLQAFNKQKVQLNNINLGEFIRLHLSRGISFLSAKIASIENLHFL